MEKLIKLELCFHSKKSKNTGQTKGGIQLIKLKGKDKTRNDINVELEV